MSFFNRYKIKNGNVSDVQDLVAKKWMDGFNSINFSSTSGKEKNTNVKALQDDSEAISVLTSINTASQSIPLYTAQNYNVPKSINVVYVDKAGAATRAYNKVLGTSTDTITPGTTAATGYTWYGLKKYIEGLDTRISNFENNLGSVLCNQRYHQADVTAAWDNGTISTAIANQSFENIQLGNYITKTLSLPILNGHIDAKNGTSTNYRCQIKFVDANAFYGYYDNYAVTATPHMAALIFGLPNDYMNPTNSTTTAADTGTGYTGYAGSYMHVKYLPAVVKALNNALGNGHLVAHNMLMGTTVGSSLVNRFGSAGGATSSWAWQMDQYITLMTEAQIYGGTIWSSSGYDTGQANTKLAAFNLVRWNKFCGNKYMWLRDVASGSNFCTASSDGLANCYRAANSLYVVPLILLK